MRRLGVIDENDGLEAGDEDSTQVIVASPDEDLVVTLVWTDPPCLPAVCEAANGALVNNLDLLLESPSGVIYTGNGVDPAAPIPEFSEPGARLYHRSLNPIA